MTDAGVDQKELSRKLFSSLLNGDSAQNGRGGSDIQQTVVLFVTNFVTAYLGPKVAEYSTQFAARNLGMDELGAAKAGRMVENVWRIGLPAAIGSAKSVQVIRKDLGHYAEIKNQFRDVLNMGSTVDMGYLSLFNSDLEVIKDLRKNNSKKLNNDIKAELAGLVALTPAALSNYMDKILKDVRMAERMGDADIEKKRDGLSELDKLRFDSAVKFERTIRRYIDKVDPENEKNSERNDLLNTGLDVLVHSLTGESIDTYTGKEGPSTLLSNIKTGALGKYQYFAGGIQNWIARTIGAKHHDEFGKLRAGTMIVALENALEKNPSLTKVGGLPGLKKDEVVSIENYVEAIFRQHQHDHDRADIPTKLEDELKNASQQIAQAMTDPRQLRPITLALLVDAKQGIVTFENGVATGIMPEEELNLLMYNLTEKSKGRLSRQAFANEAAYYEKGIITAEQFAECWENLSEEEKQIFSTFFPDQVLLGANTTKEELAGLRSQRNGYWREVVEAALDAFQEMTPAEMKELGLSSHQVKELQGMIKSYAHGRTEEIDKKEAIGLTAQIAVAKGTDFVQKILEDAHVKHERSLKAREKQEHKTFAEQVGEKKEKHNHSQSHGSSTVELG